MPWKVRREFPWFLKDRLYLPKDFHPLVEVAFTELQRTGFPREIKTCSGSFVIRTVRRWSGTGGTGK